MSSGFLKLPTYECQPDPNVALVTVVTGLGEMKKKKRKKDKTVTRQTRLPYSSEKENDKFPVICNIT